MAAVPTGVLVVLALGIQPSAGSPGASGNWTAVKAILDDFFPLKHFAFSAGTASGRAFEYGKGNVTLSTPLLMASSSKFPVATAIMGIVTAGHIDLDDMVCTYWDWWSCDSSDPRSRVTLRHLLSFTSGFYSGDAGGELPCLSFTGNNYTSDECAQMIYNDAPFAFEPGTTWDYNSFHLQAAGALAAHAANISVQEMLDRYLIKPLGLVNTQWIGGENPYLAAAMSTTGADYDRFLLSYTSYSQLPKQLVEQMEVDYLENAAISNASTYLVNVLGHYSMCNYYECTEPKKAPFTPECKAAKVHMDAGLFGYYPLVDRKNQMYMQIVMQATVTSELDLIPTILATILREIVKPAVDQALGLAEVDALGAPEIAEPPSPWRAAATVLARPAIRTALQAQGLDPDDVGGLLNALHARGDTPSTDTRGWPAALLRSAHHAAR